MYRTAALPVLAGLADVEGISHTAPNARGSLCVLFHTARPFHLTLAKLQPSQEQNTEHTLGENFFSN